MTIRKPVLLLFVFLLLCVSPAIPGWAYMSVMPLGDSITAGANSQNYQGNSSLWYSYRDHLYTLLTGANYDFQFIGSNNSGSFGNDPTDRAHEGWPGAQTSNYLTNTYSYINPSTDLEQNIYLPTLLANNTPDLVLLHIASNDLEGMGNPGSNVTVQSVFENTKAMVAAILNYPSSNINVILSETINISDYSKKAYLRTAISEFNDLLYGWVAGLKSSNDPWESRIELADMEGALNYALDMLDDQHPLPAGYDKMAGVWFNSIQSSGFLGPSPVPVPMPVFLLGSGLLALAGVRRRINRSSRS